MCYNCGCQKPDDDMGNSKNITNKTFEEAAGASGKKPDEAKKKVLKPLEKQQAAKNNLKRNQAARIETISIRRTPVLIAINGVIRSVAYTRSRV